MRILGISAFYHDSAAALIEDGRVVRGAQEERFTRNKHDANFPNRAVDYCLEDTQAIDYIAFYDKLLLKFDRLLKTYLGNAPRGLSSFSQALLAWVNDKLFQRRTIRREIEKRLTGFNARSQLLFAEHHQSHAASVFFPSPFAEAAVLTMDGVGEWTTTSLAIGKGSDLSVIKKIHFPHSIGLLFSAFTYYTGFKVNSGEYKVMGFAPYGEPKYVRLILDNLIDLKADETFWLNQVYFDYCAGMRMTNERFDKLFGGLRRRPEELLTQREMDLAASIQVVTEEVLLRLTRSIKQDTGLQNLCLAGGVALNCVASGKFHRDSTFENI